MPTIKKDKFGLYVTAGGWKARPFFGTCFKAGDEVKTHHFGGSTKAGVGLPGKASFRRSRNNISFEYWCTAGGATHEDLSDTHEKASLRWYWDFEESTKFFAEKHNKSYAASVQRKYVRAVEVVRFYEELAHTTPKDAMATLKRMFKRGRG